MPKPLGDGIHVTITVDDIRLGIHALRYQVGITWFTRIPSKQDGTRHAEPFPSFVQLVS